MSRKHDIHSSDEGRLSHEKQADRISVVRILDALRRTDGRVPEVRILSDGRNVVVLNFKPTSLLGKKGYVSRNELLR